MSSYPVQNELDSYNQPIQNDVQNSTPVTQADQTGIPNARNQPGSITQSQSAVNFEEQLQTGFNEESNNIDMDLAFQNAPGATANPLESVPDLTEDPEKNPAR